MSLVKRSIKEFVELSKNQYGDAYTYEKAMYTGSKKKIIITCRKHGDFVTTPFNFLNKRIGCRYCGKFVNKNKFIELATTKHGDKYKYHKINYVNTVTKVEIVCPNHGSFFQAPYEHYHLGKGCMTCFQERNRLPIDKFIANSKKYHGDKYDYSRVSYTNGHDYIEIKCPEHGWYKQLARSHMTGHGCILCSRQDSKLGKERFIEAAKKVHGDKYNYDSVVYVGNKIKVKIICKKHGPFMVKPNGHLACKNGCPKCKESIGELRIRNFLEKNKINYIKEYKVPPYKYRYDYYLPDFNLLIEYHGIQHYKPVNLFGGLEVFKKQCESDLRKKQIAYENNYHFLVLNTSHTNADDLEMILKEFIALFEKIIDLKLKPNRSP